MIPKLMASIGESRTGLSGSVSENDLNGAHLKKILPIYSNNDSYLYFGSIFQPDNYGFIFM